MGARGSSRTGIGYTAAVPPSASDRVLVTVTGRDRPGVTATLTGILAKEGATLHDIEQVVVQGQLTLCLLIGIARSRDALKELLLAAKELGMDLDFQVVGGDGVADAAPRGPMVVVTAIAPTLSPADLNAIAATLAARGANIEKIARLSEGALASVEILAQMPPAAERDRLKRELLAVATRSSFDIAVQREGLYRRSKRLIVLDMDSTLIRIEVIDELARAHGVGAEVSAITERAMRGEMNYDESLRQRVALLEGLDAQVLDRIAGSLPLNDGAERLIRVLKRLGYKIGILSGGFSRAADALKQRLAVDYAFSNQLEAEGGRLTGRVTGPVVNAERKAELLEVIARLEGIVLDQVVAVGDGANDILMLERAGLGIAFRAKPKLREAADTALSGSGLDAILYLLGMTAREIRELE